MPDLEITVHENDHLAKYEYPQIIGLEISGEELTLNFDPVHSDIEVIETSIENIVHLNLTLD